jgi:hypothetical protein
MKTIYYFPLGHISFKEGTRVTDLRLSMLAWKILPCLHPPLACGVARFQRHHYGCVGGVEILSHAAIYTRIVSTGGPPTGSMVGHTITPPTLLPWWRGSIFHAA